MLDVCEGNTVDAILKRLPRIRKPRKQTAIDPAKIELNFASRESLSEFRRLILEGCKTFRTSEIDPGLVALLGYKVTIYKAHGLFTVEIAAKIANLLR